MFICAKAGDVFIDNVSPSELPTDHIRIWTQEAWEHFVQSGQYSMIAASAEATPHICYGQLAPTSEHPDKDSFVVAAEAFACEDIRTEWESLCASAQNPTESVCLLVIAGSDQTPSLLAPGGNLPHQEVKTNHPAEVAWQLATSLTNRDDFTSFHRFHISLFKTDTVWRKIYFYTTAPDDPPPLSPELLSSLEVIRKNSPVFLTRVLKQTPFCQQAWQVTS